MTQNSICVIGAGSWGTALAFLLCQNFQRVFLFGKDNNQLSDIQKQRENKRYLPGIKCPENLQVISQLNQIDHQTNKFLLVVPSHAFSDCLSLLNKSISKQKSDIQIVWGTKGFINSLGELPHSACESIFGSVESAVISGPSFASEVARQLPTAFTIGSRNLDVAKKISNWFKTPNTRVYYSQDVVSIELGGAIKNVIAIAAGISDGLGFGVNARAAIITRGLFEMSKVGVALGGSEKTFMGLTGAGDLILTCTDNQSRNRRFGLGIGQGLSASIVKKQINQEIEGIKATEILFHLGEKMKLNLPITEQVFRIIYEGVSPKQAVKSLLTRTTKSEHIIF